MSSRVNVVANLDAQKHMSWRQQQQMAPQLRDIRGPGVAAKKVSKDRHTCRANG